jgi:hypothetical protein
MQQLYESFTVRIAQRTQSCAHTARTLTVKKCTERFVSMCTIASLLLVCGMMIAAAVQRC